MDKKNGKKLFPKKGTVEYERFNQLLHDSMTHKVLDQIGAPRKKWGHRISIYGRVCGLARKLNCREFINEERRLIRACRAQNVLNGMQRKATAKTA